MQQKRVAKDGKKGRKERTGGYPKVERIRAFLVLSSLILFFLFFSFSFFPFDSSCSVHPTTSTASGMQCRREGEYEWTSKRDR